MIDINQVINMTTIHISKSGPIYRISKGRYVLFFEMHRYFGPIQVDVNGEIKNNGVFPNRSPFWEMFQSWIDCGKKLNGNRCVIDDDAEFPGI